MIVRITEASIDEPQGDLQKIEQPISVVLNVDNSTNQAHLQETSW